MKTVKITAYIICFVFLFYTVLGYFAAPKLIMNYAPKIAAQYDANLSIKNITLNPFTYEANITGVAFSRKSPIFKFDEININFDPINLITKTIKIANLKISKPEIFIQKEENGEFNFSFLLSQKDTNSSSSTEKTTQFEYEIGELEIINANLNYEDFSNDFKLSLKDMDYKLSNLSTKNGNLGAHSLLASSNLANKIIIDANASLNPLKIDGNMQINELKTKPIWISFFKDMPLTINGAVVSSDLNYSLNFDENISIKANAKTDIKDINITQNKNTFIINSLIIPNLDANFINSYNNFDMKMSISNIDIGSFKTKFDEFNANFDKLSLDTTKINFDQNLDLNLDINDINLKKLNIKKDSSKLSIDAFTLNKINLKKDDLKIKNISVANTNLDLDKQNYLDINGTELSNLNLKNSSLTLENVVINKPNFATFIDESGSKFIDNLISLFPKNSDKKDKSKKDEFNYNISNLILNNGHLYLSDKISKNSIKNIELTAQNISNKDSLTLHLNAKDGNLNLKSSAKINIDKNELSGNINLNLNNLNFAKPYVKQYLNIADLNAKAHLNAKINYTDKLSAKADLNVNNFYIKDDKNEVLSSFKTLSQNINLQDKNILISNVKLENPHLKFVVSKQKELNILNLIKNQDSKTSDKTQNDNFKLSLKNLTLKNGWLEFKDESLALPFDTNITKISTTINELSNDKISNIALHGVVANYGFSEILITALPFDPRSNTDLIVCFKNINLKNITPYSVKFLGYEIDDGRLSVNLNYKIKNSILSGANSLNFDNLTLGREIPSKDAVSLPLKLAISILKDRNNQIDINLPIWGDLNNPEFSYSGIVMQAIFQLLSDVVTSPFRFIGNVLGINTDEISSVDFTPGTAFLLETNESKIKKLADIAKKKPEIIFTLTPTYSQIPDSHAIADRSVSKDILLVMNTKDLSYENALKEMFKKKFNNSEFINENDAKEKLISLVKIKQDRILAIAQKRVENLRQKLIENGVKEDQIEILNIKDVKGQANDKKVSMQINIRTR
ncbi:DUF748 domain-containing protein [Campylobacter fetus]|uniref:DUF748 domain-containing protein n=1 Tax=Campylobacter fetus TaxID=196 RepID=UPI00138E078F|nr:DUF748 domain-containing protein [Campylobacter fetus]